ncbi:MAG TPA: sigma-70 family RNA polymerase sigma factor [Pirellulales bacterium]|jgi:RNA polymerase sigma-70 factor (ECF subfamily)
MSSSPQPDALLVDRIRSGEPAAWNDLINRFEGRLLAFVESRLRHRAASEDVVQETFIGFLTSVPNYDVSRPLEGYLFSIAAHKLTDHMRREGRRPALPLAGTSTGGEWDLPGPQRPASSIARSGERKSLESAALVEAIAGLMRRWKQQGDWDKIKCAELLFVRGLPNKEVAKQLGITEQAVANHKFDFLARLRSLVKQSGLPAEVFPELHDK